MIEDTLIRIVLSVVVGMLFAMVFCLRVLVLMERRIARIELHINSIAARILKEELKIERVVGNKRKKSKKRKKR